MVISTSFTYPNFNFSILTWSRAHNTINGDLGLRKENKRNSRRQQHRGPRGYSSRSRRPQATIAKHKKLVHRECKERVANAINNMGRPSKIRWGLDKCEEENGMNQTDPSSRTRSEARNRESQWLEWSWMRSNPHERVQKRCPTLDTKHQ